jgi:hypothetical protein
VRCRQELSAFDQLLADEDYPLELPTPEIGRLSSRRSLSLLSTHLPMSGVRGEEAGPVRFVFEGGITVYLQVETELDHYQLQGQMAMNQEQRQTWTGALVEVWRDTTLAATATVDADSTFRCSLSTANSHVVRIIAQNGSVLVCPIDL